MVSLVTPPDRLAERRRGTHPNSGVASMYDLKSKACLSAALCLIAAQYAWGNAMRCGSKLIEKGDSIVTVKMRCGAPTLVERSFTVNRAPVETWTYNRGPDQFLVRIRFVDGTVVAVETLHEYGQ
jgi:hypothetical protein